MALKRTNSVRESRLQREQTIRRGLGNRQATRELARSYAGVSIDHGSRCLIGPKGSVPLTKTEWLVLDRLARSTGAVVTREAILTAAWGGAYMDATPLLHDAISRLRRRFQAAGATQNPMVTLHGVGYRLVPD